MRYFLDPKVMTQIGMIKSEDDFFGDYIQATPRETFQDILDAIDRFVYFENRKNKKR